MNKHAHPILLVEDNEDDIVFMKRCLLRAEVAQPLHVVNDGQQAIDYLAGKEQFADRVQFPLPGLVLLDLKLPRKGGLEVLEWIRQQPALRPLVVLILTTSKEPHDIDRALRLGANAYLVKPASVLDLIEMLKAIRQFWFTFNEFSIVR